MDECLRKAHEHADEIRTLHEKGTESHLHSDLACMYLVQAQDIHDEMKQQLDDMVEASWDHFKIDQRVFWNEKIPNNLFAFSFGIIKVIDKEEGHCLVQVVKGRTVSERFTEDKHERTIVADWDGLLVDDIRKVNPLKLQCWQPGHQLLSWVWLTKKD